MEVSVAPLYEYQLKKFQVILLLLIRKRFYTRHLAGFFFFIIYNDSEVSINIVALSSLSARLPRVKKLLMRVEVGFFWRPQKQGCVIVLQPCQAVFNTRSLSSACYLPGDVWSVLDVPGGAKAHRTAQGHSGCKRWRRYAGPSWDPFPEAKQLRRRSGEHQICLARKGTEGFLRRGLRRSGSPIGKSSAQLLRAEQTLSYSNVMPDFSSGKCCILGYIFIKDWLVIWLRFSKWKKWWKQLAWRNINRSSLNITLRDGLCYLTKYWMVTELALCDFYFNISINCVFSKINQDWVVK